MLVVVCPGQGSQTPGFLSPWMHEARSSELLTRISEQLGIDLVTHGSVSDADTIRDTAIAQPLIVAAGLMAWAAIVESGRLPKVHGVAGHSVGEVTAAAASGILSESAAVAFVRERADAMAAAAARTPSGMSAVLGGDEAELLERLDQLGLEPANFNGGGQIVVAGAPEALRALADNPPARARVIPLRVAGAFHTRYMEPARDYLRDYARSVVPARPTLSIWTNRDGSQVTDGQQFVDAMVTQVASPVRWDRCMQSFADAGVTGIIELTPAGTLTGLAKRALKGVESVSIASPEDLPAAFDLIDRSA